MLERDRFDAAQHATLSSGGSMSSELISGGFYLTRLLARPAGLARQVPLPERLMTLSSCLTAFLPDDWALAWVSRSEAQRLDSITKLGIPSEQLGAVMAAATVAFDRGELGWSCVWQSLSAARAMLESLGPSGMGFLILELGVPEDFAQRLLPGLAPAPGMGDSGLHLRSKAAAPLHEAGVSVGWEPLGIEVGR